MFLGVGVGVPKAKHSSARRSIPDITPTIGALLGFATPFASGKPMAEILTSVENDSRTRAVPSRLFLAQNYPNPFNPSTTIHYDLSVTSHVQLDVYDVLGQIIDRLVDDRQNAGTYSVKWDASRVSSGIYFYCLRAGEFQETRKMVLVR